MRVAKYSGPLPEPIQVLEAHLERAGTSLIKAAFRYSFFIDPERVRERCPYYPNRARMSREHYPGADRGSERQWKDQPVRLGDNSRAQMAWAGYTGRAIARGSGYGVRHIWGNPWDPNAFTAGWNLCYMPFWLGMLTEDQHPHAALVRAIQQASFDLYFKSNPVCDKPDYVVDPGLDLADLVDGEAIQLLTTAQGAPRERKPLGVHTSEPGTPEDRIKSIRSNASASWSNLVKASAALQGLPHDAFGTEKVESSSKSVVRRMCRETGLSFHEVHHILRMLQGGFSVASSGVDMVSASGSGPTTRPGYTNSNGQTVIEPTGLRGTDHMQYVYALRCGRCNRDYGANGSDIHIRKCPFCQGGAPGLPLQ
jgi:hypothetical protein